MTTHTKSLPLQGSPRRIGSWVGAIVALGLASTLQAATLTSTPSFDPAERVVLTAGRSTVLTKMCIRDRVKGALDGCRDRRAQALHDDRVRIGVRSFEQRLEEVRSPHGISLVDFSTVHCEKSTPDSDRSVRAIPQCHWSCAPMWLRTCTSGG